MDNSSYSNSTSVPPFPTTEAYLQLTLVYAIGCGIFATTSNALITLVISKNKQELKSRFYIIVRYLSISRFLFSLNLAIIGITRLFRMAGYISPMQPRVLCMTMHIWIHMGIPLEPVLIQLMVIDRAIAIVTPLKYATLKNKLITRLCQGVYCYSIFIRALLVYVANGDFMEIVQCISVFGGQGPTFAMFWSYFEYVQISLVVIAYICLIIYIRVTVHAQLSQQMNQAKRANIERQLAIMPVLRNQVILYGLLSMTYKLIIALASSGGSQAARLTIWGGNLLGVDVLVNSLAILFGNRHVRNAAMGLIRLKTTVTPILPATS